MKLHEKIILDHRDVLESTLTQDEMAKQLNVSRPTIRKALELIGVVNKSPVGDFLPLVDENYPPLTKDRKSEGKCLPALGQSHKSSLTKGAERVGSCLIAKSLSMKIGGNAFQRGRVAYAVEYGQDTGSLNVNRTCCNNKCIEPTHLDPSPTKAVHRVYSSIVDEKVLELVACDDLSISEIANRLGISKSYVSKIARERLDKRRVGHRQTTGDKQLKPKVKSENKKRLSQSLSIPNLTTKKLSDFHNSYTKTDSCWIWTGNCNGNRARFSIASNWYRSARVAYSIYTGVDPGQWDVLHMCDNTLCVNPEHLILGDAQLNSDHKYCYKTGRPTKHLSEAEMSILSMDISRQEKANLLGVSTRHVSRLQRLINAPDARPRTLNTTGVLSEIDILNISLDKRRVDEIASEYKTTCEVIEGIKQRFRS